MEEKLIERVFFTKNEKNIFKKYYGYCFPPKKKGYEKVSWLSIPVWVNQDIFDYGQGKEVDEDFLMSIGCYLFFKEEQRNSLENSKIKFSCLILLTSSSHLIV